ncbi:hypothetical protein ACIP98_41150 [Streptomyces sp. NPDC088354]|uniref:hypothetical protein n=1 Tax=Streptomyces sp. NPDC088354 TaxID=3365856 RepID=UPI003827523A
MSSTASQTTEYRAAYIDMHTHNLLEPAYETLSEAQQRCEGDLTGAWTGDGLLDLTWERDGEPAERWRMMMQTEILRMPVSTGYEVVSVQPGEDAPRKVTGSPSA